MEFCGVDIDEAMDRVLGYPKIKKDLTKRQCASKDWRKRWICSENRHIFAQAFLPHCFRNLEKTNAS